MSTPMSRRAVYCSLLVFATLIIPIWTSYAQEGTPTINPHGGSQSDLSASTASHALPASVPLQGPVTVYLPLVMAPPVVGPLQFGSGENPDGTLINPGTTFNYGITELDVSTVVQRGQNLPWRMEWFQNGQPTGIIQSDTIPSTAASYRITRGICYGPAGNCGDAIPRGTYQVNFYLNNVLYQQGAAVIK